VEEMPKRKREFTEKKYNKYIAEGRGSGVLSEYKPWFNIQDVSSSGRSSRVKGIKTGRQHEFLSDNETNYFYILDLCSAVKDIREQYPILPIENTLDIADELGIQHPSDPRTKEHTVVTTDFLITTYDNRLQARTIKMWGKLDNERQMEKFEIERTYWERQGVDWGIVTEKEIDKNIIYSLKAVHPFYYVEDLSISDLYNKQEVKRMISAFKASIVNKNIAIRSAAFEFENRNILSAGTGIEIYKHLVATSEIIVGMKDIMCIDTPVEIKVKEVI
jgi:hypothetical protein